MTLVMYVSVCLVNALDPSLLYMKYLDVNRHKGSWTEEASGFGLICSGISHSLDW
jgi:hypothetical protein